MTMRNIININEDWKFIREDAGLPAAYPADWSNVNLPHTWNAVDGNDGNGSYYRGTCWLFPLPTQQMTMYIPRMQTLPSMAVCITSIWQRFWTSVPGSGLPMCGICLTSAALPVMKAVLQVVTTRVW